MGMTKICSNCKEEKPIGEFYKQPDRKNGQSYCKKCFNGYCAERWTKRKVEAIHYKGGGCNDCHRRLDDDNPTYLFDFHHVNPSEKECVWTKLRLRSWEKIKKELDKCVCLCVICHRHREYGRPAGTRTRTTDLEDPCDVRFTTDPHYKYQAKNLSAC